MDRDNLINLSEHSQPIATCVLADDAHACFRFATLNPENTTKARHLSVERIDPSVLGTGCASDRAFLDKRQETGR